MAANSWWLRGVWLVLALALAGQVGWQAVVRAQGRTPRELPQPARSHIQELRLRVYVQGAVRRPGAYQLPLGARVLDALLEAGGALPEANLADLNLVAPLSDGAAVQIASLRDKGATSALRESAPSAPPATAARPSAPLQLAEAPGPRGKQAPDHRINLNRAGADELGQLPGIGPKMAQDIVAYRQQLGRYRSLQELRRIRGIGEKRLKRIQEYVTL